MRETYLERTERREIPPGFKLCLPAELPKARVNDSIAEGCARENVADDSRGARPIGGRCVSQKGIERFAVIATKRDVESVRKHRLGRELIKLSRQRRHARGVPAVRWRREVPQAWRIPPSRGHLFRV